MSILNTNGLCSSLHTIVFKSDLGYASQGVDKKQPFNKKRTTKTKMNANEFLDKVLPRTTMSKEEMAKAVSDASEDSLFRDAEKCFRSMGDNSGICAMLSSEEVSEIASRLF